VAIQFLGSNGFITRLGALGDLFNQVVAFSGDTFYLNQEGQRTELLTWRGTDYGHILKTLDQHIATIADQFTSSSDRDLRRAVYADIRDRLRDTSRLQGLVDFCHQLVIETASREGIAAPTLAEAWREVIRQMKAQGISFMSDAGTLPEPTVATVAADGDPAVAASIIAPGGIPRAFVFSEDISVNCTSQPSEFTILGQQAEPDPLSGNWALFRDSRSTVQGGGSGNDHYFHEGVAGGDGSGSGGSSPDTNAISRLTSGSGCQHVTTAVDAAGSDNLLTNGSFDTFGTGDANARGTPQDWTVLAGSPGPTPGVGTDLGPTSDSYANARALQLVGQSSPTLPNLMQTLTSLKPSTVYAVNAWLKQAASTSAGVIQFRLVDGNGSVISDDQGTANALAATASSNITTSYAARSGFFRTPSVMPAVVKFQIIVTTAITSTKSIYLDHLALAEAEELYIGGPWVKVFAGATPSVAGDAHVIHVTNGNPNQYPVAWLERVFGLRELGIYPPFANTGYLNISDMLMGVQNT
jgi:hypothetical protein